MKTQRKKLKRATQSGTIQTFRTHIAKLEVQLKNEINAHNAQVRDLNDRLADFQGQIVRLTVSRQVSPGEMERMKTESEQLAKMNAEWNKIGLYFRQNYAAEIAAGQHGGSLADIVIRYLSELKTLRAQVH